MTTTRLDAEIVVLSARRRELLDELREIEAQIKEKHCVLINAREVETTAVNVQRVVERRMQPCD